MFHLRRWVTLKQIFLSVGNDVVIRCLARFFKLAVNLCRSVVLGGSILKVLEHVIFFFFFCKMKGISTSHIWSISSSAIEFCNYRQQFEMNNSNS